MLTVSILQVLLWFRDSRYEASKRVLRSLISRIGLSWTEDLWLNNKMMCFLVTDFLSPVIALAQCCVSNFELPQINFILRGQLAAEITKLGYHIYYSLVFTW